MRRLFFLFAVPGLLLLSPGCVSTSDPAPTSSERRALYDSLRGENARLRSQIRTLQDSIQFYDDVDSGSYARERRALRDQMTRMAFELSVIRDGGLTVAMLGVDALFEPASATLTEAGREQLKPVAAQLRTTYPGRDIRVEGHSDTTPLSENLQTQFPSNWELSTARAAAVVRALSSLSQLSDDHFVAIGFGATDPVASNETEQGRKRNRRVRVAVLPLPQDHMRPFETSW